MYLKFSVSLLFLTLVGCSHETALTASDAGAAIIGGTQVASRDELRGLVVQIVDGSKTTCTGTIVGPNLVVTAGHCVDGRYRGRIEFREGYAVQFGESERRAITAWSFHPDWMRMIGNDPTLAEYGDVMLVRFEGEMPQGFRAAELLEASRKFQPEDQVLLAGFGSDEHENSGLLRKVVAPILSAPSSSYEVKINQRSGVGACRGDSGGPAFVKTAEGLKLWGVTSRMADLGDDSAPAALCHQSTISSDLRRVGAWFREAAANL